MHLDDFCFVVASQYYLACGESYVVTFYSVTCADESRLL